MNVWDRRNGKRKSRGKKVKKKCFWPGSNRRPFACEANVITATLQKPMQVIDRTRRMNTFENVNEIFTVYDYHTVAITGECDIENIAGNGFTPKMN